MVQLQVLTGGKAGVRFTGTRFPIQVGRDSAADISLDEPGVWPKHFRITRQAQGLVCDAETDALLCINGEETKQAVLRGGDIISIGAIKIRFELSPARQSSLAIREWLVWMTMALICLGQVALIYEIMG